jgi:hypothetical protein
MRKAFSLLLLQIRHDLSAVPPRDWTLKQKWQYYRTFGVPYLLVGALLSTILIGLEIWILETETRLGFSSHWIPWLIVRFGWLLVVPFVLCVAAWINRRNGHVGMATFCMLIAALVLGVSLLAPDWFLVRVVSHWLRQGG